MQHKLSFGWFAPIVVASSVWLVQPSEWFAVEADTELEKTFVETTSWNLESMTDSGTVPEVSSEIERRLVVTDAYTSSGDGRPLKWKRTLETAESMARPAITVQSMDESYEVGLESPWVGQTVQFEWQEDEEAYLGRFESGEEADTLHADMDFLFLAPAGDAEKGDSWEVEGDDLLHLFAPGGDFQMALDQAPDGSFDLMSPLEILAASVCCLAEVAREDIDGQLDVEWEGTEDGVALLALKVESSFERDMGERTLELASGMGFDQIPPEFSLLTSWQLTGEGQARWNLEAGHFEAVELEIENAITIDIRMSAPGGAREAGYELVGTTTLKAEAEAN